MSIYLLTQRSCRNKNLYIFRFFQLSHAGSLLIWLVWNISDNHRLVNLDGMKFLAKTQGDMSQHIALWQPQDCSWPLVESCTLPCLAAQAWPCPTHSRFWTPWNLSCPIPHPLCMGPSHSRSSSLSTPDGKRSLLSNLWFLTWICRPFTDLSLTPYFWLTCMHISSS